MPAARASRPREVGDGNIKDVAQYREFAAICEGSL
jgi:hypothetical protein